MRCYLVKLNERKRYAATQAESRETRDRLLTEVGGKKGDATIEQTDMPLSKADLLEFINKLLEESET